jgi:hypothetical protein
VLLFGITILCSACLLFLVQPLASKLILPWFGGSAAVWITCMLFFQTGLLLGYLYAHALARRFTPKRQAAIHCVLLLLSLAVLPILPNPMWQPKPGEDPIWRVFGVLATSVGLPYILLSSTSPLVQSWYANRREGALPYRYFALSNAGSLAALLAYPVFVEPYFTGHQQAWMWSAGFVLFAAICVGTAFIAARSDGRSNKSVTKPVPYGHSSVSLLVLWLSLAACASTLLLTVTNLLTQNIAPMPLLWVLPLGLYLLTFILCFESGRWYQRIIFMPLLFPALWCLVYFTGTVDTDKLIWVVPLLLASLFVCCMACHGELARLKPASEQLTTFYLSLSAGGALGGLFVALFAPRVFPDTLEHPIACILCPSLLLAVFWRERGGLPKAGPFISNVAMSLWLAAAAATLLLTVYEVRNTTRAIRNARALVRNFYGSMRVQDFTDEKLRIRELSHGTIVHGIQSLDPNLRHVATTYYGRNSGIGLTWRVLEKQGPLRMGVIGLGAGTLAAYGRGGDTLRFYDINPLVVDIAKTQFTFLNDCAAHVDIALGDARLTMSHEPAREPDQRFDILVIDAFSGDAVPIHLLTREAFQIYWSHMKPDGVIAVHVSNHYLNLPPVVMLAAQDSGKQAHLVDTEDDANEVYSSSYVLVSARPGFFEDPLFKGQLRPIAIPRGMRPWTDDFSNLWRILKFGEE